MRSSSHPCSFVPCLSPALRKDRSRPCSRFSKPSCRSPPPNLLARSPSPVVVRAQPGRPPSRADAPAVPARLLKPTAHRRCVPLVNASPSRPALRVHPGAPATRPSFRRRAHATVRPPPAGHPALCQCAHRTRSNPRDVGSARRGLPRPRRCRSEVARAPAVLSPTTPYNASVNALRASRPFTRITPKGTANASNRQQISDLPTH